MQAETLSEAVGHPARWMALPTRSSPSWENILHRLELFTDLQGDLGKRGPNWLWHKIQRRTLPKKIYWGELLRGWEQARGSEVRDALLRNAPLADIVIWSWNARWLVDLQSPRVRAKRAKIEEALKRGYVVCIQETHWLEGEARMWLLSLLCHDAFHSAACDETGRVAEPGNGRTGRLGGVVTLIPPCFKFDRAHCRILVPGRVILTRIVDAGDKEHNVVNCYLETGNARSTWDHALAAIPRDIVGHPGTIFIGDFNTDLASFRNEENQEHTNRPDLLEAGVVLAPCQPTCSVGGEHRTLDGAVVPGVSCASWEIRATWSALSDHAMVIATRSSGGAARPHLACTPHRFWALPQEARAELREDFEQISQSFGVPRICGPTTPMRTSGLLRPGDTDPTDGILGLREEPEGEAEPRADAGRNTCTEEGKWNPLLAAWGHAFVHACFRRWWMKWRRRSPSQEPCVAELREISSRTGENAGGVTEVSTELQNWLGSVGGPTALSASEAKRWLGVWLQIDRASRDASLPRRHLGPTAVRDPPSRATVAGRMIYGKRRAGRWIQLEDGTMVTDPLQIATALISTRRHIWFAKPSRQDDPTPLLEAYMCNRAPGTTEGPPLCLSRLRGAVLAFSNSGVGGDGTPYEAYHLHPQLIACLLAQGFLVLDAHGEELLEVQADPCDPRPQPLDAVLGPPMDLLIWIPKEVGNRLVTAQRPLHLPTCLRRIFGAAGMGTVGPALEPHLDPSQAARLGGCCQQNIRQAFQHLASPDATRPADRLPHNRWACRMLFGQCMEAVLAICLHCQAGAHPSILNMAACFLLDQAKAFEFLSHTWLRHVIRAWKLPPWMAAFLVVMAAGRKLIGNPYPGKPGEALLRGIGMGGPASLFTWAFCFDPVAWIAKMAAACETLLYVDDLLGETRGPGQTLLLYMALLAATKRAGLRVEEHVCVTIYGPNYKLAAEILACFPVRITETGQGRFAMTDGPVEVYLKILVYHNVCPMEEVRIIKERCRCKTKHALVPARDQERWAVALAETPLTAAVTTGTRFLGAHLCGLSRPNEIVADPGFTRAAVSVCASCTFLRCIRLTEERVEEMKTVRLSLANRSAHWNTFCVSTVPYPASILPIPRQDLTRLWTALRSLFPCHAWICSTMITDLGMALGLRGTPRDPGLVADTASIMSLARGGLAGPEEGHGPCIQSAREVREWASSIGASPDNDQVPKHELRAARKLLSTDQNLLHFGRGPEISRAVYTAMWSKRRRARTMRYLLQRSQSRRWRPSEGQEWTFLSHSPNWTVAWVIARIYCNGIPGTAKRRLRQAGLQDRCWGCGEMGVLKWKWLSRCDTPGAEQAAVGWCGQCTEGATRGQLSLEGTEEAQCTTSEGAWGPLGSLRLPGAEVPRGGAFQRCPLCGNGEAGSEHLAIFCVAVSNAWNVLGMTGSDWWLGEPNQEDKELKIAFNHAVAWLCCALSRNPVDSAVTGCGLICRQMSANRRLDSWIGDPTLVTSPDVDHNELAAWEWPGCRSAFPPCSSCPPVRNGVTTYFGRHAERNSLVDSEQQEAALRLLEDAAPSTPILTLRAGATPAAWPRSDCAIYGWPLTSCQAGNNCRWVTSRCHECGIFTLSAIATKPIPAGSLVRSEIPPMVVRRAENPGLLISFDGGARRTGGGVDLPEEEPPVAGAGAAIWSETDAEGHRECLAQITISAPRLRSSMLAEAAGLAYGVLTLAQVCSHPGPIAILGDNLPIIQLGACNSRLRSDPVWAEVEDALMLLARRQWKPQWHAVRRHLNRAADALATMGVIDALRRLDTSSSPQHEEILIWHDEEAFRRRGWSAPTTVFRRPCATVTLCNTPLLAPGASL